MSISAPRSQRINLRATTQEVAMLRRASALKGCTLTTFILSASIREAESLVAETHITSPEEQS